MASVSIYRWHADAASESIQCRYESNIAVVLLLMFALLPTPAWTQKNRIPPVVHSHTGEKSVASGNVISLTLTAQKHGYGNGDTYDADISSPKSVKFSKDGSKFYVNSLEGGKTVVYESRTLRKLKVIRHHFTSGRGPLWSEPSGFYNFTHYLDGDSRAFTGKPVESCLTPDGCYLFVPYYRRTFDINAQDPSAMAVIDTRTDSIVAMMETGPLPKMVCTSNDGRTLAITHWGNNTVGLVDISASSPRLWKHRKPVIIDRIFPLRYPLDREVNRDSGSGYSLRGTLFLPGDSLMLVSAMGGAVAVIDVPKGIWLGWIPQLYAIRHIVSSRDGYIYFSRNSTGEVLRVSVDSLISGIGKTEIGNKNITVKGIEKIKVGGGTRTIELSPTGRFLFAACNTASALYVVDTHTMKVIAVAPVDSYPVGLDVSPDGSLLVVTSQGRKGYGGNAVNIFSVCYLEPETVPCHTGAPADTAADGSNVKITEPSTENLGRHPLFYVVSCGLLIGILAVTATVLFLRIRKRRKS